MKKAPIIVALSALALATAYSASTPEPGVKIVTGFTPQDTWFKFEGVPSIARNDAAGDAKITVVAGDPDDASGSVDVLNDDSPPSNEDSPEENFFFGSTGRIEVDLGKLIDIKAIASYSWHAGARAPQVYKLYVATGTAGFNAAPKEGVDPASCGWKLLGQVDTRPAVGGGGGQHGAQITSESGASLGKYQHVLFDIDQGRQPTFFSEIDVIDAAAPEVHRISPADKIVKNYDSEDGKIHYTLDASKAPDLLEWSEKELIPAVKEWYPKLITLLPSEGFTAPDKVNLRYMKNISSGAEATISSDGISISGKAMRDQKAPGAVIQELVHIVQSYDLAAKNNPEPRETPQWVIDGLAEYVRYYVFEPEKKGAAIAAADAAAAKYDAPKARANFIDYVNRTYGGEIVKNVNAAARDGKYSARIWKKLTDKKLEELAEEWKQALQKQ